ncbi:MAG TPA: Ig-like domain repeat protein, partial [Terracidiphilus sp.]|nr:Ig-like domain repeat protein [Terracidiphilus sp.]
MLKMQHRSSLYAGMLLCPVLLAATPSFAQQIVRSAEPPQSILSLAPAPRPQGELLARHAGDSRFENAPANYHVFAAATVGQDAGVEVLTLNFAAETRLTRIASKNKDFVVEPGGTCIAGDSYAKGGSCTLLVRFNPQGPGHRLGFITVEDSADATPMSFGLMGNGYAPVVSFTPSVITTVTGTVSSGTGTISSATSLAVDGGDIVYIADTGNVRVKEIDSSGTITSIEPAFTTPASIAVDSSGFIYNLNTSATVYYFSYISPWEEQSAFGYTYAAGTCTPSAPCSFATVGMGSPAHLSIDASDDLYFEEGTYGAAEMPVGAYSAGVGSLNLWYLKDEYAFTGSDSPHSFAVDAVGDLFTSYYYSSVDECELLGEPLYDAEYAPEYTRVAGGSKCGFSGDGGQGRGAEISSTIGQIAFDIAGNLYFADAGNQRVRRIDALTGIIKTIAGNGTAGYAGDGGAAIYANLSSPTGVGVDSQGQVYILSNAPTAGPTQVLRKVGVTGRIGWVPQLKGTTSGANIVTVSNTGNDTLTLSSAAFFNGANPSEFAIDPNTTTCTLSAGATLAAGKSCEVGIVFTPAAAGYRAANLVLLDDTVTGSNTIQLSGTGTLPVPTMSITSPTTTTSLTEGVAFTFAVSVTSTSSTKPTGTVTFKVNGTAVGSPVTLSSSGTASTSVTEATSGSYTLTAVYSGDTNYATDNVSESVTVAAIKTPVTVNLIPAV